MDTQIRTHKRVDVTLPQETLQIIDQVVRHGDRSRFIDNAVRFYIDQVGKANLRMQLKEGSEKREQRDLEITKEWFLPEEDVWRRKI